MVRSDEEEQDSKGFRVVDHRRFDDQGNSRSDAGEDEGSRNDAARSDFNSATGALPDIDFSTFLISLSTSAMMHLGQQVVPEGQAAVNLPLAKQTIDILGMLQQKTAGNLTAEEASLFEEMLYNLRLHYVEVSKR
jgi:hypothetical protein